MDVFEKIPLFYAALPASQQVSSEQPWFSLRHSNEPLVCTGVSPACELLEGKAWG